MKVQILDEAEQDLVDGFRFYEAQSRGLGDYFLVPSNSTQVYTLDTSDIIAFCQNVSPLPSTTMLPERLPMFTPCWTVDAIRLESRND